MGITRDEFDGVDLIGNDRLWLEDDGVGAAAEDDIVATPRINVQYAEEWSAKVRLFFALTSRPRRLQAASLPGTALTSLGVQLLRFCWAKRKRYPSLPLGATQSPISPAMLFSAPLAEAVATTASDDATSEALPAVALLTDT
jgi:hypothetical protein